MFINTKAKNIPTQFIIFGGTGDLVRKKIAPALYTLFLSDKLPQLFQITGFSRRDYSREEYQNFIKEILEKKFGQENLDSQKVKDFLSLIYFVPGKFGNLEDYQKLANWVKDNDQNWEVCNNKLFYLSVSPEFYTDILNNLKATGLSNPCSPEEGWSRIIIEKPFGEDASSAQKLDTQLKVIFREEQIFRIDHYLAKETLQNILAFRFFNPWFEDGWNNDHIESIQARLWETMGVEDRGSFYEQNGTFKDVGQNHLLQMIALVTMDKPEAMSGRALQEARAKVLSKLKIFDKQEVDRFTYRAQYKGYRNIQEVDNDSHVETFFKNYCFINNSRWHGVEMSIQSGKRMEKQVKDITVNFRPIKEFSKIINQESISQVIFCLEPEEKIVIKYNSKKPDMEFRLTEKKFESNLREPTEKRQQYTEEYQKMIYDAICGDQSLFNSIDEVVAQWTYVDPIITRWKEKIEDLDTYEPNSHEATLLAKNFGFNRQDKVQKFGLIGLGKMGAGLARNALRNGYEVVGYNRSKEKTEALAKFGLETSYDLSEMVSKLPEKKVIWLMLPAGKTVEETIFGEDGLVELLKPGDMIIEGGNSFYKNSKDLYKRLAEKGIKMIDIGVSGGPGGALNGACIMAGGKKQDFDYIENLIRDLCIPGGYQFFEGDGAGHFVKMVHNGIEYGMMQAIAEGFEIMKKSYYNLDLEAVTKVYNNGSVIESSLIKWLWDGYESYGQDLESISSKVNHSGEGQWTVDTAKEMNIPVPIIEGSLDFRKQSESNPSYTGKVLSVLRNIFGGHAAKE